jgi:hypothetical protein
MPRAPTARRAARLLSVSLALGLATILTIAFICSWRAPSLGSTNPARSGERMTDPAGLELPWTNTGTAAPGAMYFELRLYEAPGATFGLSRLRPFTPYAPTGAPPPPKPPTPESIARRWERAALLPWVGGRRPWPNPAKGDTVWARAAGWPLRTFMCTVHAKNAPNFATHTWSARGGVILGNPTQPGWADWPPSWPTIIPLTPLWPELLASTALYTAAWLLPISAFTALRRARRSLAGHCPRCAYDLRGNLTAGCPECGWGRV